MDLDERIEEFRNSLPEKKREAFDSLPHEYKQTLIDPEAIRKMAQASLNAAGVMKRTPAKLPSFPAPYSLPGSFLDELDEHPVVTFIQIKKEFNKEFSTWVAGCCQYLGSFIELNSGNFYVNLTQCHLNRRNIEACAKLVTNLSCKECSLIFLISDKEYCISCLKSCKLSDFTLKLIWDKLINRSLV